MILRVGHIVTLESICKSWDSFRCYPASPIGLNIMFTYCAAHKFGVQMIATTWQEPTDLLHWPDVSYHNFRDVSQNGNFEALPSWQLTVCMCSCGCFFVYFYLHFATSLIFNSWLWFLLYLLAHLDQIYWQCSRGFDMQANHKEDYKVIFDDLSLAACVQRSTFVAKKIVQPHCRN